MNDQETIKLELHIDDLDTLLCTLEHLDYSDVEDQFVPGTMSEEEIEKVYDQLRGIVKYLNRQIG